MEVLSGPGGMPVGSSDWLMATEPEAGGGGVESAGRGDSRTPPTAWAMGVDGGRVAAGPRACPSVERDSGVAAGPGPFGTAVGAGPRACVGESMITLLVGGALRKAIPTMTVAAERIRLTSSQAMGTLLDSRVFMA